MEYICNLCGFVYDESVRGALPADYACPLCGGGISHFQPDA